jgi:hypothetical protein
MQIPCCQANEQADVALRCPALLSDPIQNHWTCDVKIQCASLGLKPHKLIYLCRRHSAQHPAVPCTLAFVVENQTCIHPTYDSDLSAMPCHALPCHACICSTAAGSAVGSASPAYKACDKGYHTKICLQTLGGHKVLVSSQEYRGHLCINGYLWMNILQFEL